MDKNTQSLYIMIGLPGSGKSSWAKANRPPETIIINDDSIRSMIHGGQYFYDTKIEPIIRWMEIDCLRNVFRGGYSAIIDDPNITREERRPLIDIGRIYAKKIIAVWAVTTKEQCKINRARELRGYTAEHWGRVIDDMASRFEPPTIKEIEQFDDLIIV